LQAWRNAILSDRPHALIYKEIGMDPRSLQLAAQRLAPVPVQLMGSSRDEWLPDRREDLAQRPKSLELVIPPRRAAALARRLLCALVRIGWKFDDEAE
jgi:hypothetical protein